MTVHRQSLVATGRHNAPIRIECSCGVSTTADTEQMAEDRITAHQTAAKVRDSSVRRAELEAGKYRR